MFRLGLTILVVLTAVMVLLPAAAMAGDRFVDNGDGTVTDRQLKVMWAKYDNQGDVTWQEAERFCRMGPNQILGLYDNWRMPTIAELESLFQKNEAGFETDCGQMVRAVPEIKLSCGWVWSGEKKSITARVFNFHRGYVYTDRLVHKQHYRALAVRNLSPGQ